MEKRYMNASLKGDVGHHSNVLYPSESSSKPAGTLEKYPLRGKYGEGGVA